MATKSGSFWVTWANQHAKNSSSVDDLSEPFRSKVKEFIDALEDAGATVSVTSTLRHPNRAFLFHWCWRIGLGKVAASQATPRPGVDIQWDHGNAAESKAGAKKMIDGFGLAVPPSSVNAPALNSIHIRGEAIDMNISWQGVINVKKKDGTLVPVTFRENVNLNRTLHKVGASYGVIKLTTDRPHWSVNGG